MLGGTYTVCLTVSDLNGCTDIVCNPVVVLDLLDVHVPNAFTPDGDGTNDLFVPVFNTLVAVEDYEFLRSIAGVSCCSRASARAKAGQASTRARWWSRRYV